MNADDIGRFAYLSLLLLVIGYWFFRSNRQRLSQTLQQAAIWVLIFLGAITAFGFKDVIREQLSPNTTFSISDSEVVLRRAQDGHFYARLLVNDVPVDFIVDTGASGIVLTQKDAKRVGIDVDNLQFWGRADTANGKVGTAEVRLEIVKLGEITDFRLRASVNEGELFNSLLGLTYLNLFSEVRIKGNELHLIR